MNSKPLIGFLYKIGRSNDNDFVLSSKNVSSHHAEITCLSENTFLLEDKNSTNGTFVNGFKIQRVVCTRQDQVFFGDHYHDLNKGFPIKSVEKEIYQAIGAELKEYKVREINQEDFSEEFAKLKSVYTLYMKSKSDFQKLQQKIRVLQASPAAVIVGISMWLKEPAWAFAAGSLGGMLGVFLSNAATDNEKSIAIDDEFKIKYCCPKCKTYFGVLPWESLANKRHCGTCKALLVN